MALPLPHDIKIATKIRAGIAAGVSMRVIFDSVATMKNAPKSYQTFYKIYRDDIADARASIQEEIGSVVITAARGGDIKAAELFLRSRAGWNQLSKSKKSNQKILQKTQVLLMTCWLSWVRRSQNLRTSKHV